MSEDVNASWERFLNPDTLRQHLIFSSMFISAFEILKDSIVDHIKNFYINGFDGADWKIDPEYKNEVLDRSKSPIYASLDWLKEHEAIDQSDIDAFDNVRKCRNEIAHQLPRLLSEGLGAKNIEMFGEMVRILKKIEVWWIVNLEIPANPDFDGKEIDEAGIVPGSLISLQLMMDIALGAGEKDADWYYKKFKKMTNNGKPA